MGVQAVGRSIKGSRHQFNEDRFLIADLSKTLRLLDANVEPQPLELFDTLRGHVMAVADGVSGAERGAESSELASEVLVGYLLHTLPWFEGLRPSSSVDLVEELRGAFEACHGTLVNRRGRDGSHATTLTLAYVAWRQLYVAHVGDSRCYLVRDGSLFRSTRDQTLAQQLVDQGDLEPEAAAKSRLSHVLTSALGSPELDLQVQVVRANLEQGDRVLLTSDGAHGSLDDSAIAAILERHGGDDSAACDALVQAALDAGETDDITCVLGTFSDHDEGIAESLGSS